MRQRRRIVTVVKTTSKNRRISNTRLEEMIERATVDADGIQAAATTCRRPTHIRRPR